MIKYKEGRITRPYVLYSITLAKASTKIVSVKTRKRIFSISIEKQATCIKIVLWEPFPLSQVPKALI